MKKALDKAANMAGKRGYVLAITNPIDGYMSETNFLSKHDTIFILTHIPLMKLPSVVDLYRYEKTPINLANSSKHIIIEPDQSIIAVNNDRSLYVSMSEEQLQRCTKLHDKFWCPFAQVTKKTAK